MYDALSAANDKDCLLKLFYIATKNYHTSNFCFSGMLSSSSSTSSSSSSSSSYSSSRSALDFLLQVNLYTMPIAIRIATTPQTAIMHIISMLNGSPAIDVLLDSFEGFFP